MKRPGKRALYIGGAVLLLIAFFFFVSRHATAEDSPPYVPPSDDVILEKLPTGRSDPAERAGDEMRRELAQNPRNLRLAVRLAKTDIELSRSRSDPRYLGHAEAALAPWYKLDVPPHEVVVLRATIRQSNHDFDGALADLDIAVSQRPDDAQVWITRAVVLTVRAEYVRARQSCERVRALAQPFAADVCIAAIDAVTGNAQKAYDMLTSEIGDAGAPDVASAPSPAERAWAVSTLGEIALRKGDLTAAETHFKEVLTTDPSDAYVLGVYADLLLDTARPQVVVSLLRDRTENDALLLRLALAERALAAPDAKEHVKMLRARYDASRLRGDVVHRREQARFALFGEDNPSAAVALASANWEVQREPADARILLESAKASGNVLAATPVADWLTTNHVEDPKLLALAKDLR